jgi:hypothetical protein
MQSRSLSLCFALLVSIWSSVLCAQQPVPDRSSGESRLGHLPLVFEPNRGQAKSDVRFLSRGNGYTVLLGSDKTVLVLSPGVNVGDHEKQGPPSVVTLQLVRSNKESIARELDELPGKSNYFIGKDPGNWISGIPQYGRIEYKSIYDGIDLVYYGNDGQLECDFILAPGADPRTLSFRVKGANKIDLNPFGNLSIQLANGVIELQKPTIYQEVQGLRHLVAGNFALRGGDEVGLDVGDFDRHSPLIIDPVLSYSTLIGANNSTQVQGIAVDPLGNIYITGTTFANNYPVVDASQSTNKGSSNVIITKLNPAGDKILYSTYLGGSGFDNAAGIAVDGNGSAYVTGTIGSSDFPTTPGAFMTTCPSICNTPFVSKFLSDGTLAFSTFMGGSNSPAHAIAVDSAGEAYIAGDSASNDLPTTSGSFEPIYSGMVCTGCYNGYVEKLNASGTGLVYSTYFGLGNIPSTLSTGIAVDSGGSAYLVGTANEIPVQNPIQFSADGGATAFITKFSPDGSQLIFSTYLGGGGDSATGVAVDPLGNVHVTGTSSSCYFPLSLTALSTDCAHLQSSQKVFVATLNSSGSQLLFSTFLQGGTASGVAVDKIGNTYVTGTTPSSSLPVLNPIIVTSQLSASSGFVSELDLSGRLLFSTYLGATGGGSSTAGIAVDSKGGIYIAGAGQGDFPLLHPIPSQVKQLASNGLFVAKISPKNLPQFSLSPRVSPVLALRNVSSVPLTISAITSSTNFKQGGDCGSSLAPGTGCTLILEGADDRKTTGTVTITSNAFSKPQEFVISKSPYGDGVGAILTIFPLYMQFPPQLIGTTSAALQIVIENSGLQPAAINSIQMIQPSAFNETNNCPAMLNPFTSCTISLTYTSASAQDSAQLAIVTDPNQTRYTAFLGGSSSPSALAPSTPLVQFGSQLVGSAPLGRIVNFINTTPYPAGITGVSVSTGFAQTNTCTAILAPQASCRASVTYIPATNENATGTLTAAGFGPGGAQNVSLYGTGLILSDLAASPLPLTLFAYVNDPPASNVVTLTNTSRSPITLSGFQVSGPFSQTNKCPGRLGAGASCDLTVTFSPTQGGTFNGSVSIANSGQNSPQVVPTIATAQTVFSVTPALLDFGQQKLHVRTSSTVGIGNGTGHPAVTVSSITVQGTDFKLLKNTCPTSYPSFTGCGLGISFTPSKTGLRTGTVTIVASDSASPHVSSLQGTGISTGLGTLSATNLDFGTQTVGTQSQPTVVTLTNTGTGTLVLNGIAAPPQFTQTNTCGASLTAGASCAITIQFVPNLPGILVGSLSVQDDGAGSPHALALSGIGQ